MSKKGRFEFLFMFDLFLFFLPSWFLEEEEEEDIPHPWSPKFCNKKTSFAFLIA